MDEKIEQFRKLAHAGKGGHEEALKVAEEMSPKQMGQAIAGVHASGELGSDRQALREAVAIMAQAKIADQLTKAAETLSRRGEWLTWAVAIFAAVQALAAFLAIVRS